MAIPATAGRLPRLPSRGLALGLTTRAAAAATSVALLATHRVTDFDGTLIVAVVVYTALTSLAVVRASWLVGQPAVWCIDIAVVLTDPPTAEREALEHVRPASSPQGGIGGHPKTGLLGPDERLPVIGWAARPLTSDQLRRAHREMTRRLAFLPGVRCVLHPVEPQCLRTGPSATARR